MSRQRERTAPRRCPVIGLMALAVLVQVLVWGVPRQSGGAWLAGLRPWFGVAYGALLLGAALAYCATERAAQLAASVLVTAASVVVVAWCAVLAGAHLRAGAAASLAAGFATVALGAGVFRAAPGRVRPPRP